MSSSGPSQREPTRMLDFREREKKKKIDNRDHLPRRLVFPQIVSGDDCPLGSSEGAKSCDQKFPADDEDHRPGRNIVKSD